MLNYEAKFKKKYKLNNARHFYLYAKGHYKKTDTIEDLKHIVSEISWIYPEYINERDIKFWLLKEVYKYINSEDDFIDFLTEDMFFPRNNDLISKCLSKLKFLKISDIDIELGDPDPKVLSLTSFK